MLNENIRNLRKSRGLSQDELAARLHVVRQTISKWENGLSVPDSEMLIKLAAVFEVSVSDLLGAEIPTEQEAQKQIAEQLQQINEQLAIRNRRTKKVLKVIAAIIIAVILINTVLLAVNFSTFESIAEPTIVESQEYEVGEN
ncbi:MAG: helix-turn-helix domain-containing protein [Lachnospiraceae bacterium]|nr:helix-turn-helix domain-containing protein [Lachnospiraceae bacterium]